MKHLKLRGELTQELDSVLVSVVEQTHVGDDFGHSYTGGGFSKCEFSIFTTSADRHVILTSYNRPISEQIPQQEYVYEDGKLLKLYLNGISENDRLTGAKVSLKNWTAIKEAVTAYNTVLGGLQ